MATVEKPRLTYGGVWGGRARDPRIVYWRRTPAVRLYGANVTLIAKIQLPPGAEILIKIFDWKSVGFSAICDKTPGGNGSATSYGQPSRITTGGIWRFDKQQRRCARMTIFLLVIGDIARFGQNPAFSLVKTFDFETGSDVLKLMISLEFPISKAAL